MKKTFVVIGVLVAIGLCLAAFGGETAPKGPSTSSESSSTSDAHKTVSVGKLSFDPPASNSATLELEGDGSLHAYILTGSDGTVVVTVNQSEINVIEGLAIDGSNVTEGDDADDFGQPYATALDAEYVGYSPYDVNGMTFNAYRGTCDDFAGVGESVFKGSTLNLDMVRLRTDSDAYVLFVVTSAADEDGPALAEEVLKSLKLRGYVCSLVRSGGETETGEGEAASAGETDEGEGEAGPDIGDILSGSVSITTN